MLTAEKAWFECHDPEIAVMQARLIVLQNESQKAFSRWPSLATNTIVWAVLIVLLSVSVFSFIVLNFCVSDSCPACLSSPIECIFRFFNPS